MGGDAAGGAGGASSRDGLMDGSFGSGWTDGSTELESYLSEGRSDEMF